LDAPDFETCVILIRMYCLPRISVKLHCLKEEATSYKMQRPPHNQPYRTYSKDSSENNQKKNLNGN